MRRGLPRYTRQIRLPLIGATGQDRIGKSDVALVGLGALGTAQASYLARAGVGRLRLIDRDTVELPNLQRQILYSEQDVAEALPKAVAARRRLQAVNSEIEIRAVPEHLGSDNAGAILSGVDLVLDGTDNLESRFLINDYCAKTRTPWIYGACVGTEGLSATFLPGRTPCLRCLIEPGGTGTEPTCETAGVLGPLAGMVGAFQACRALRVLATGGEVEWEGIWRVEGWSVTFRSMLRDLRPDPHCATCGRGQLDFLEGRGTALAQVLCGRDAVQIASPVRRPRDLEAAEKILKPLGEVTRNPFVVKARIGDLTLSLFPDGRVIVGGTTDPARARALVDRCLGGA